MASRPKNILIVTHHYPPHITGVGMIAENHAKRLAALGYMVTVITSETSPDETSTVANGVNVIRIKALNFSEKWGAPFPIFSPALLSAVFKHVRKADIVHIHDAFYMSSFWTALVARIYKKPIVLTEHVAMINHPSKFVVAMEKMVYATTGAMIFNFSNLILTYNERVEEFLSSRGIAKEKLAALTNGVDTDFFRPADDQEKAVLRKKFGFAPNKKVVLFVGRFVPKKGLDKVFGVRDGEYQIACAGGTAPKDGLDNIVFLGKLDQKTLAEAYRAADIFLLPSESEGFPLSIQEAMASGLPVIATYDPGYKKYAFDDDLIFFIKNPTEATLKQAIQKIVNDDGLARNMSRYSREYALNNFSWSSAITKLDALYDALRLKPKVAIVSDSVYPFNKGGKEKRIYDITTRLAADGADVTVYCMNWWHGDKKIMQDGVRLYAISPYYALYAGNRRSIKEAIFFSLHCLKLLTKDFDVIEVDHMPHLVLFTTKIVCVLKRKKMIVTWHEVWGKEYWRQYLAIGGTIAYWIEKVSATLPDVIISVSDHTTRSLREILHTRREIITIPNGSDIAGIMTVSPSARSSDIIFAGRLLSHKNVDVLLASMKILVEHNPKLSLFIVGEGPEKEKLENLARDLGIQRNVSFLGFLEDHDDLYRIMSASKVFVLPSTREGFGITVLEANACGLPVVTIDHEQNAARELVVNGENGFLIGLKKEEMARAIETTLATRQAPGFYRAYAERHDWSRSMASIEKVYAI